jgi:uncharacterized membrane protein YfhO
LAVGGITFNAMTHDCAYWMASILMPLEYPFTELGMGEDVFMGTAKIFQQSSLRDLPLHFYTASFLDAISTPDAKILEIKKPIEYQSMDKKQRLPHF